MRSLATLIFAMVTLLAFFSSAQATLIYNVDGDGQLTGAQNVDLGNLGFFNVEFIDGSCVSVFDGCNAITDFDFTTEPDADLAAQALLDQVFLDVTEGLFDTDPGLTRGCNDTDICVAVIPFDFEVATLYLSFFTRNGTPEVIPSELKSVTGTTNTTDFSTDRQVTFAKFTFAAPP